MDDAEAWKICHVDDLWVFNKLTLYRKLGYICGPHGASVPKPGRYVVKPCVNTMGYGAGAKKVFIADETDFVLDPGTFWSEEFIGRHLSIDYKNKKQVLCVEGFYRSGNMNKFAWWKKVEDEIEYPEILNELKGDYEWINIEMIGDKIMEIHLRRNKDFLGHDRDVIYPVWRGDSAFVPAGHKFVKEDHVGPRLGYFIKE